MINGNSAVAGLVHEELCGFKKKKRKKGVQNNFAVFVEKVKFSSFWFGL